ncbi:B12-binding domain-containing radical SAM protein [bacterium]|jgi:radical SAM superfamily enzyme YgiQ (UPF0313 family)|nr:B12-binding domain-containing radical SAM protein [bacterium]
MKVVLIRPPLIRPAHHLTALETFPPLHLAYLNASLGQYGHQSKIIDGQSSHQVTHIEDDVRVIVGYTAQEILDRVPADVEVIGVNCMYTYTWFYDSHIIRLVKKQFPHVPIIIGGEHASACADELLAQTPEVSAVVVGEGEYVIPELAQRLGKGLPVDDLPGVTYRDAQGKPTRAGKKRIMQLDDVPFPSWEGVPLDFYFQKGAGITQKEKRSIPMIATRGCPHTCSFCTVSSMWNSRWTPRSPENVILEMKNYYFQFQVTHFDFLDLTLVTKKSWVQKFCTLLEKENLPITWALPIGTRTEALDGPLLAHMTRTGLTHIMYSAESASEDTLQAIQKKLNVDHLTMILKESVKCGLVVKLVFVNGFPGQKWKDVLWNWAYIVQGAWIGIHDVVSLGFVPYPGSTLYDELKAEGRLDKRFEYILLNNDLKGMRSWTKSISDQSLRRISFISMSMFYAVQFLFRPQRFLKICYRFLRGAPPYNNFELIFFNMIKRRLEGVQTTAQPEPLPRVEQRLS